MRRSTFLFALALTSVAGAQVPAQPVAPANRPLNAADQKTTPAEQMDCSRKMPADDPKLTAEERARVKQNCERTSPRSSPRKPDKEQKPPEPEHGPDSY